MEIFSLQLFTYLVIVISLLLLFCHKTDALSKTLSKQASVFLKPYENFRYIMLNVIAIRKKFTDYVILNVLK